MEDTYVSMPNVAYCASCKRQKDLRMGYCFDCVEAESIIHDGKDMYEKGDAKTALQKVKFLIEKGWKPPEK